MFVQRKNRTHLNLRSIPQSGGKLSKHLGEDIKYAGCLQVSKLLMVFNWAPPAINDGGCVWCVVCGVYFTLFIEKSERI